VADTKVSALSAVATPAGTDEFPVNQGGTSKKETLAQVKTFANTAPVFAAGTASAGTWPVFTAGTLLTAAVAGTIELDANCFYATTDAGNRGVLPVWYFIRQHADRAAFTSNTSQQAVFDSIAGGTLTLETGFYIFDGLIQCKSMSSTSGNLKWSLKGAGGATLAVVLQHVIGQDVAVNTAGAVGGSALITEISSAASVITGATATVATIQVRGSFECTGAGTIIPSVAQTTAAAAVITAGSYFRCCRLGASSVVSCGQWS
jgi:hypothetical protein